MAEVEVDNPAPPNEAVGAPASIPAAPLRLGGFSDAEPGACSDPNALPTPDQFSKLLAALATAPEPDGAFEVVALADGCARLVEARQAGEVRRWELRRFDAASRQWLTAIAWDFDPGVKRPTTIDRYSFAEPLHRFGEWARDELHHKRFVRAAGTFEYTHYRGQPALYALEPGRRPRRISSNLTTPVCRTDGTNHCDDLERTKWNRFTTDTSY